MNNREFTRNSIEAAIRLVLLLAYWCYLLVKPFIFVLALGYELFMKWLNEDAAVAESR